MLEHPQYESLALQMSSTSPMVSLTVSRAALPALTPSEQEAPPAAPPAQAATRPAAAQPAEENVVATPHAPHVRAVLAGSSADESVADEAPGLIKFQVRASMGRKSALGSLV